MKAWNYQQRDGLISTDTLHQKFQWITYFTQILTPVNTKWTERMRMVGVLSFLFLWHRWFSTLPKVYRGAHWGPRFIYDYSCLILWALNWRKKVLMWTTTCHTLREYNSSSSAHRLWQFMKGLCTMLNTHILIFHIHGQKGELIISIGNLSFKKRWWTDITWELVYSWKNCVLDPLTEWEKNTYSCLVVEIALKFNLHFVNLLDWIAELVCFSLAKYRPKLTWSD